MTDRQPGPARVFTIPAGVPFLDALARGILADERGGEAARATVLLPNRRACRALAEAMLRAIPDAALLLPSILPIGDIGLDEAFEADDVAQPAALDPPPAIPPLRRQLLLAELIRAREGASRADEPARIAGLATELARLLDQVETEELGFDRLAELVPETLSAHWQTTLDFLRIVTDAWPAVLEQEGAVGPAERRSRLIGARIESWRRDPPEGRTILAGSTGSVPATRALMAAVVGLPGGAVVLPGLDREPDPAIWDALDASHPQYGLKLVLDGLGMAPREVALWPGADPPPAAAARTRLLAAAMRPAGTGAPALDDAARAAAVGGVCRIDCAGAREEAATVALLLRETLETPDRTAALVTPDRGLARRVAAELERWGVEIDDSGGAALALTPPGAFLLLLARALADRWAPVPLLSLLKHPLAACGMETGAFRARVRALERAALRGPRPEPGADGLKRALRGDRDLAEWFDRVADALAPLDSLMTGRGRTGVADLAGAHIEAAERLAAAERLWAGEDGATAAGFMDELRGAARGLAPVDGRRWPDLLETLMRGRVVRPRYGRHPRLQIWGALEARLQGADRLVLGGLNEGTWPAQPPGDPWMSRPMRAAFGLPSHERRIGLSAHDFSQFFAAPEVFLTRAVRVAGTPTVPSRWLLRLDNALRGEAAGLARGAARWTGWQAALDRPEAQEQIQAPAPVPPVAARPRQLSVTQVETLIRDPYAIYARHVLGLKALDPIDADPGGAERGRFVHDALDAFLRAFPDALPEDAYGKLMAIGEAALGRMSERPGVRAFWWPRFERVARWFVEHERGRRARIAKTATELTGRIEFEAPAGPFILTARADRIDVTVDGRAEIVDYKTGAVPSGKDVAAGLAPQLPLEAAILAAGGFEGIDPASDPGLVYWRLSGGDPPGEEAPVEADPAAVRDGLERLIGQFDDPAIPYIPQPHADRAPAFSDYEHLERLAEYAPGRAARRRW
ncbi:MAG: double-strand break repair protein AddB [Defluviicoccus sp.]|nr:double-strand break repair protein AddB [Defluviicoccus sp.]